MASKPILAKETKRILNERGERLKEPIYIAPINPSKKNKPSNK